MLITIGAVLAAFLVVGLRARRRDASREDYFVAGRSAGRLSVAGSLFATAVGGSATVGVVGLGYGLGMTGAWWTLVGVPGLVLLGLFVAPRLRRYRVFTLPGLLQEIYGTRMSAVAAALIVVAWVGVVAGQIAAAGILLAELGFGGSSAWMAVFTVVLIVYAVMGGQRAVIKTDAVQACMILLGLSVAFVCLLQAQGGLASVRDSLPTDALSFPTSDGFRYADLLRLLLLVGTAYVVGPDMYSRVLSSSSIAAARGGAFLAAFALIPVALFTAGMGVVVSAVAPVIEAESALPWLMSNGLPSMAGALLLVALVAALMSSADSTLLGQSIVLANDVVGRVTTLSEARTVQLARLAVVVLGASSCVIASVHGQVIASLMFAYSIFASGVVGPVLLGLFGGRFRPSGSLALFGLCIGGTLGLLGAIPVVDVPHKSLLPVAGLLASVLVPLVATLLSRMFGRETGMV